MAALLERQSSLIVRAQEEHRPLGMFSLNGERPLVESLIANKNFLDIAVQAAFDRKVLDIGGAPDAIDCYLGGAGAGKDAQRALQQKRLAEQSLYLMGVSTGDDFKDNLKLDGQEGRPESPFNKECARDADLASASDTSLGACNR